jgi:hypothetical protein
MSSKRSKSSKSREEAPAMIQCEKCGHCGGTRSRGFPALSASDLQGRVLRCSRCGHRQPFDDTPQGRAVRRAALAQMFAQASRSERVH